MLSSKFLNIAKVLQEYEFKIEADTNKDLTCVICLKLLNNAYNSPCGCRYCLVCITENMRNGENFCPGKFEECKEQKLKLDDNLLIDQAANTRISRLLVKCPEVDCDFQDELKKIEDHIRVCDVKPRNCPYSGFGCTHSKISHHKMSEHLANESYNHAILMLDWMQNLKNEVASVEEKLESYKPIKRELQEVKMELEMNKKSMIEIQEKMNQIINRKNRTVTDNSDSDESTNSSLFAVQRNGRRPFEPVRCRGRNRGRGRSCGRQRSYGRRFRGYRSSSEDRINDNPQPLE